MLALISCWVKVAPVRERGLKSDTVDEVPVALSRSRKGAWIEILEDMNVGQLQKCRSRKVAWIEIT